MTLISIIREDDDPIADVRISLGSPRGSKDFYIVFRGDPDKVIALLHNALITAQTVLPNENYEDHRRTVIL